MHSRRQANRARTLRRAKIVFAGGHRVIDCLVMDLSERGARLKKGEWLDVPDRFELRIVGGERYDAELCYHDNVHLGVRFASPRPGG